MDGALGSTPDTRRPAESSPGAGLGAAPPDPAFTRAALVLSAGMALLGGAVLAAWYLDLPALTRLAPGWVPMKANTALLFLLLGAAQILEQRRAARWAPGGLALVGLLAAAATLAEYAFSVDLQLDQVLVRDTTAVMFPGRMSPITAMGLLLLAAGVLALGRGRERVPRPPAISMAATAGLLIASTTFCAYVVDSDILFRAGHYIAVALPTALAFLLGFTALLLTRPEGTAVGMFRGEGAGSELLRRIGPLVLAGPLAMFLLVELGRRSGLYDQATARAITLPLILASLFGGLVAAARSIQRLDGARRQGEITRAVLESLGEGVVVADQDGRMLLFNPAAEKVLGRGPVEGGAGRWSEAYGIFQPDGRTPFPPEELPLARAIRGEASDGVELLAIPPDRPDGITLLLTGRPVRGEAFQGGVVVFRDITERKRLERDLQAAQERLRSSEERLRMMIEGAVDYAILMLDLEGRVVSWNRGAERIKGYRAEEILGESFTRFYPPEDVAAGRPLALLGAAAREGRIKEEGWRVRKDGTRFWAEVAIHALRDEQGVLRGFGKMTRDLTERRRAEEELERNERRFHLLADHAPVGIYQLELESGACFLNAELCAQAGLPPGCSREAVRARLHPEDAAGTMERFGKAVAGDGPFDGEYRYLHPDGRTVWVHGKGMAVRDREGRIASFIIVSEDITRRRAAEEAVRQSEERFRALAESASDAIVSADGQGLLVYWNGAAEAIFGHGAKEALGRPVTLIIPEDFRAAHEAGMARRRANGEVHVLGSTVELQGLHKDGRVFPVELSLSTWSQASQTYYTALIRDISARKAAEAAVQELNQELRAANQELEAFAYSVSHDLRAPLRHIDGFVGLLRSSLGEASDPKSRRYIDIISGSAKQMGALIDDLLSFSRMGRAEVSKVHFDLRTLVERVVEELAPECAGRAVEWHFGELPVIHGDPALLRLALLNLLGNALKFTRHADPARVEVSAARAGDEVILTVRDNGAGFDMQYASKLFGVFQRLHRQDEFEGTGIGLANVARIAQKHGGRVSAEGAVGQGATFHLALPLSPPPTPPPGA